MNTISPYAIVTLSLCSLRATASHKSEMVSQLLLGELCTVKEYSQDWAHVKNETDGYQGWVLKSALEIIQKATFIELLKQPVLQVPNGFEAQIKAGATMWIPEGALLRSYKQVGSRCEFEVGQRSFEAEWEPKDPASVVEMAMRFLNTPYLWGGKSKAGMDCSALTQLCYSICGLRLWRDASQQAIMGTPVSTVAEAREGDLAFFTNESGQIIHVGIVLNGSRIIHSSGCVRMDALDQKGIYREAEHFYSHHLHSVRRILP